MLYADLPTVYRHRREYKEVESQQRRLKVTIAEESRDDQRDHD
jgi:hypothetical protein